jgi:hypothetical protein
LQGNLAAVLDVLLESEVLIRHSAKSIVLFVVIESIREFNRAVPFVPYEIHTASGECYEVPHPDFISISPKASL